MPGLPILADAQDEQSYGPFGEESAKNDINFITRGPLDRAQKFVSGSERW